jgi:hypothetical protein
MKCKNKEESKHDIPIIRSIMYFMQIIHAKELFLWKRQWISVPGNL